MKGGAFARWPGLAIILAIAVTGAAVNAYAYWPGIWTGDSSTQYQQALDNAYQDWHPPIMAWIWRQLIMVEPGPAPMLLLQLALYWAGFALAGSWAWRRGRFGLGLALVAVGWLPGPMSLQGMVVKDSLTLSCLVMASGIMLWRQLVQRRQYQWLLAICAILAIGLAAALQFNAFLACFPLLMALAPGRWVATKSRVAATGLCAALALFAIIPAINAALQTQKTFPRLTLIQFDLGGITALTGVNQFPEMGLANPVAANQVCYNARTWDTYSPAAQVMGYPACELQFGRFQDALRSQGQSPTKTWLASIVSHPFAYAAHRIAHFNSATWFLVGQSPNGAARMRSVPNPWGYQVQENGALTGVSMAAVGLGWAPLGWPFFWLCSGLAVLILTYASRPYTVTQALAASAVLYGFGYLVVGMATDMRYHAWTISGACLAAVLLADELVARKLVPARKVAILAAVVVVLPTTMAVAARLIWA